MDPMPSILLVEDSRFLRTAGEEILREHGFAVEGASDGEQAIVMAETTPPALIVLDLVLPQCQGFEVLTRLKQSPRTAHIPVLIISKLEFDAETLSTFRAAGVSYIHKTKLFLNELVTAVELAIQFGTERERVEKGADAPAILEQLASLQVQ